MKRKLVNRVLFIFIAMSIVLWFTGCTSDGKKKTSEVTDAEMANSEETENTDLKKMYYGFPSVHEVFYIIGEENLTYKEGLVNTRNKVDNYTTTVEQSFNLGIYSADLAYLTLFKKNIESEDYYELIFDLAEKIRIRAAFDESFLDRVKKNINNVDSLEIISEEAVVRILDFLIYNNKEKTLAVVSTGSIVEVFYLLLHTVDEFNESDPLIKSIVDHKYTLENILAFTKQYKADENVAVAYGYLNEIMTLLNSLEEVKVTETTVNEVDEKLIIKGGKVLAMNEEQFQALKTKITEIRSNIVQ